MSLCGGDASVAESFATALWAPDALLELMKVGVDGVNWHIRSSKSNAPFALGPDGLLPRPELYGLAVFAQLLRSATWLREVELRVPYGSHLKVWAVSTPAGPRLLLINKGPQSFTAHLHPGGSFTNARVERLSAPSPVATTGVTLGGQTIGSDGRWHGSRRIGRVSGTRAGFAVALSPYSAALVSFAH